MASWQRKHLASSRLQPSAQATSTADHPSSSFNVLTDQDEWHFYDCAKDPYEQHNLYGKGGAASEVRWQTMQTPLYGWMQRIGDRKIPAKLLK